MKNMTLFGCSILVVRCDFPDVSGLFSSISFGSLINLYLWNQCLSPIMLWFWFPTVRKLTKLCLIIHVREQRRGNQKKSRETGKLGYTRHMSKKKTNKKHHTTLRKQTQIRNNSMGSQYNETYVLYTKWHQKLFLLCKCLLWLWNVEIQ